MGKCKCIQEITTEEVTFVVNKFYEMDYVPAQGDKSPQFRIYHPEGKHVTLNFTDFKNYFKKFN